MKKITVNENELALVFKNGKFEKILRAGSYTLMGKREAEIMDIDLAIVSEKSAVDSLLRYQEFADSVEIVDVKDDEFALYYKDGMFKQVLEVGKHAFLKEGDKKFEVYKCEPEATAKIPPYVLSKIPAKYIQIVEIPFGYKAVIYFDNKPVKEVGEGVYLFWRTVTKITYKCADTRLLQTTLQGQEILTLDKVALRVNFVVNYRITDFYKMNEAVGDFETMMHSICQLALREYIGKFKLDQILEDKDGISAYVHAKLIARCSDYYVDIVDTGVKDIILPGAISNILNTVLIAEKKAQANVITRREEVASTRSLLNTAKLMEDNPTLYKLKELEYVERICENVGNINLNGSSDILEQLTSILGKR